MRFAPSTAAVLISAALVEVGLVACTQRSFSDYPPEPDASQHDSSSGASSGIFMNDAMGDDVLNFGDATGSSSGSDCAIPNGTYAVTATPSADAGPSCSASTSTITFPMSHVDGGPVCSYTPNGSPPSCAVTFICTSSTMTDTTTASGFINVFGSSIAGTETVVVTDMITAKVVSTCDFTLSYVKH